MKDQTKLPPKLHSALTALSEGKETGFLKNICTVVETCAQLKISSEHLKIFKVIESSTDHLMVNADDSLLSESFRETRESETSSLYQDTKDSVKKAAEALLKN